LKSKQVEKINRKKLSEVCEIFSGGTPSTRNKEYWNGDIPWLSSGETRNNFIVDTERKITLSGIENSSTRLAKKNDVVVASAGQGNTRGQVSLCLIDTYVNQSVLVLRTNNEFILPKFLFYNLKSRYNELRQISDSHSSRGSLPKNVISAIDIMLPSLPQQEKIAKILFDLDFKIENILKQNNVLEQILQAIFKSWFVDFDGVTKFENSELGNIPKGWKIMPVGNISDSISLTHSFEKDNLIFLNTGDIKSGKILHSNYTSVDKFPGQAKKSIKKNDILFTEIRPKNKRYAFVDFDSDDYVVSTKLMVIRTKDPIFSRYVYQFLTNDKTLNHLQLIAETRSGTFPQITFDEVKPLKILIPTKDVLEFYNKLVIDLSSQIKKNWLMITNISKISNLLLPKLMSGEIRI